MDGVALVFDRPFPEHGYGYVGASRSRSGAALFHVGRLRTTDWRPVGEPEPPYREQLSVLSDTSEGEPHDSDFEELSEDDGYDPSHDDKPYDFDPAFVDIFNTESESIFGTTLQECGFDESDYERLNQEFLEATPEPENYDGLFMENGPEG